jgi:hypothetical protein
MENTAVGNRTITLSIGGVTLATTTSTANHVVMSWDSRRVGNGSRTLVATVADGSDASGTGSRAFNVQNAGGGGSLTAAFTGPASGATVSGPVTIGMSQTGASGTPSTFTLAVDSSQAFTATGTASSASFAWNSRTVGNGVHALRLTVRDGAGRTATTTRTVTVSNSTPSSSLSIAITQPRTDTTVRGTVWFTIWVNGSSGGSKTYTLTDGGRTLNSTTTTSAGPVSIPWVTSAADNGLRTPTVTVREGTATGTGSVRVTVGN